MYVFLVLCNRLLRKITYCKLSVEKCWHILLISVSKGVSGFICCSLFQTAPLLPKAEQLEKNRMDWELRVFYKFQAVDHILLWNKYYLGHLLKIYRPLKLHRLVDLSFRIYTWNCFSLPFSSFIFFFNCYGHCCCHWKLKSSLPWRQNEWKQWIQTYKTESIRTTKVSQYPASLTLS